MEEEVVIWGSGRHMHYGYAEYLAIEKDNPIRHEYLDGEIYAMAGGTLEHAVLASAAQAILRPQLAPGCRTFTSDLRIRVVATGLSTYPDGGVVCGKEQYAADDHLALINPVVLIEVTSNSSEEYDRGQKLEHYWTIPSITEIVIISHRQPRITVHRRQDSRGWTTTETEKGDSAKLESLNAVIAVDDLYRDVIEKITRASPSR